MEVSMKKRNLILVAFLAQSIAYSTADVLTTPVSSKFSSHSRIAEVNDEEEPTQSNILNPLSASTSVAGITMNISTDVEATWTDAANLQVSIDILRPDSDRQSDSFLGRGIFCYIFTIDVPTTIEIDYDFLATSTSSSTNSAIHWWVVSGFDITVNSDKTFLRRPSGSEPLTPDEMFSYALTGTHSSELEAGTHTLTISGSHNATGNVGANRTSHGTFDVRIGAVAPEVGIAIESFDVISSSAMLEFIAAPSRSDWKLLSGDAPSTLTTDITGITNLTETESGFYLFTWPIDSQQSSQFFRVED